MKTKRKFYTGSFLPPHSYHLREMSKLTTEKRFSSTTVSTNNNKNISVYSCHAMSPKPIILSIQENQRTWFFLSYGDALWFPRKFCGALWDLLLCCWLKEFFIWLGLRDPPPSNNAPSLNIGDWWRGEKFRGRGEKPSGLLKPRLSGLLKWDGDPRRCISV